MRIRSTKPEFWRSERIATVSWDARLVLKGLESYVDDNGVGKDDIALIVGDLFQRDLVREPSQTLARVSAAISELREAGLVWRYAADGTALLYLSFWEDVQRVDKPQSGRYPRPDGTMNYRDSRILASPRESSRGVPKSTEAISRPSAALASDSESTLSTDVDGSVDDSGDKAIRAGRKGPRESSRALANPREPSRLEQGNRGTEEQSLSSGKPDTRQIDDDFAEFWAAYPRKIAKPAAAKAYRAARKRATAAQILDGLRRYRFRDDPEFIPHPQTWLNQDRWVPEQTGVVRQLRPGDEPSFTSAELDQILGPDTWTPPRPPEDIDPETDQAKFQAWHRQVRDEHRRERVQQALALTTASAR